MGNVLQFLLHCLKGRDFVTSGINDFQGHYTKKLPSKKLRGCRYWRSSHDWSRSGWGVRESLGAGLKKFKGRTMQVDRMVPSSARPSYWPDGS